MHAQRIEGACVRPATACAELPAHRTYSEAIEERLKTAKAVVVI